MAVAVAQHRPGRVRLVTVRRPYSEFVAVLVGLLLASGLALLQRLDAVWAGFAGPVLLGYIGGRSYHKATQARAGATEGG